mmetsp:Transcript_5011/g.11842  ORF Transcript_5011/g.11842 Transcript_5011/m.11842 type:complete len:290 (-) Transcript_5011:21-890(-)
MQPLLFASIVLTMSSAPTHASSSASAPMLGQLHDGARHIRGGYGEDVRHDFLPLVKPSVHPTSDPRGPALILVNYKLPREILERLWSNASVRVCADGAINRLYASFDVEEDRSKYIPEYIRGDLDSVDDRVKDYYVEKGTKIVHDLDQDTTDLEKCMDLVNSLGYPMLQVIVLGAFGGRLDHEFSHYHVLYKYPDIKILLLSRNRSAFLLRTGTHNIRTECLGPTCGLIPLGAPCRKIETTGLKWDIHGDSQLQIGSFVSTSNRIVGEEVKVTVSDPILWVSEFRIPES